MGGMGNGEKAFLPPEMTTIFFIFQLQLFSSSRIRIASTASHAKNIENEVHSDDSPLMISLGGFCGEMKFIQALKILTKQSKVMSKARKNPNEEMPATSSFVSPRNL